ncbi:hypothetical protein [Staphylococcus epidermidis]|nr:hypothetical protein [Staphylococcus epidermidis]
MRISVIVHQRSIVESREPQANQNNLYNCVKDRVDDYQEQR